jgi:hypothetical protein
MVAEMKKIPCLFQRDFTPRPKGRGSDVTLRPDVTSGCEHVLAEGVATVKLDGTACAVIESTTGEVMSWVPLALRSPFLLYRRYDAKNGKPAPPGGIPCDDPDPTTGHWPHWIPVGDEPESKYMRQAYVANTEPLGVGTYEFAGPHIQGNPMRLSEDNFILHGNMYPQDFSPAHRSFDGLRAYLAEKAIEGIVFWLDGEPRAKIRRKDFGFPWPLKDVT